MSGEVEQVWPRSAPIEAVRAGDAYIESYAAMLDSILLGLGDVLRSLWPEVRPAPSCDCAMDDPHHRWNCALTPIWAQTIRDLDCNPWTVIKPFDSRMPRPKPFVWFGQSVTHCGRGPCCLGDGHDGRCQM